MHLRPRVPDVVLYGEDMLLEILTELRPTDGRSVHDGASGDCRSVRAVAALGGRW
ncbi:hypothetical protein [Streptomyces cellulosae]|uniref:Uncharacterized protein n=1 Tax=Streptomyces cellulosae TaxID=1968 RepID=A0ABW7YHM4_STRCE